MPLPLSPLLDAVSVLLDPPLIPVNADRRRELRAVQDDLAGGRGDAARVRDYEISGYGSECRWSHLGASRRDRCVRRA
jgi:hypothetical protein